MYPRILRTKTHPEEGDKREFKLIRSQLYKEFKAENFIEDYSADKMPHKIPKRTELEDEKAIVIIDDKTKKCTTISEESLIIRNLTEKINIQRIYVKPVLSDSVKTFIQGVYESIKE